MKPTKEAAQASFENGDADLANAYLILDNPQAEGLFGIACFHCHQAVEKYLKGFLLLNGEQPPLIHDLKLLLDECVRFDENLSRFDNDCRDLNPYYIETRYEPGAPGDFEEEDTRNAYRKAEDIIEAVRTSSTNSDSTEYMDLVNDEDEVVGKDSRDAIYAKGLKSYRVVNIFVFNPKGELLLPKRDSTRKIFPNCYDFSCGEHVESDETYEEAAIRGLREELNLENVELVPIGKLTPQDGVSSFMKIFKVVYAGEISPNKDEGIESIKFYPLDKIKNMI